MKRRNTNLARTRALLSTTARHIRLGACLPDSVDHQTHADALTASLTMLEPRLSADALDMLQDAITAAFHLGAIAARREDTAHLNG